MKHKKLDPSKEDFKEGDLVVVQGYHDDWNGIGHITIVGPLWANVKFIDPSRIYLQGGFSYTFLKKVESPLAIAIYKPKTEVKKK